MIRFKCRTCGMAISVMEEHAGKTGECSGCHQKMVIPAARQPRVSGTGDALSAEDNTAACTLPGALAMPERGWQYVAGLDLDSNNGDWEANEEFDPVEPDEAHQELPTFSPLGTNFESSSVSYQSTAWLQGWLAFYARINFILSIVVSAPVFLFGLVSFLIAIAAIFGSVNSSDEAAVGGFLVAGGGLLWALLMITAGLLYFMLLNVFTLACHWGREVLRLLEVRRSFS